MKKLLTILLSIAALTAYGDSPTWVGIGSSLRDFTSKYGGANYHTSQGWVIWKHPNPCKKIDICCRFEDDLLLAISLQSAVNEPFPDEGVKSAIAYWTGIEDWKQNGKPESNGDRYFYSTDGGFTARLSDHGTVLLIAITDWVKRNYQMVEPGTDLLNRL